MSSTQVEVVLEYAREGDLSFGKLYAAIGGERTELRAFEGLSFQAMLYELARKLQLHPEASVFFLRSDRSGAVPYRLDPTTVALLRADPVAAVHAMTYPGSPSTLFRSAQERVERPPPTLRMGFDVLADAFGRSVYARLLHRDLECPGCGYWSPFQAATFSCQKRCRLEVAATVEGRWASILVVDLLATGQPQFYLPRRWNSGPWITKDRLEAMYLNFTKEKEGVTCSMQPP